MGGAIAGGFSLARDTALWMRAKMLQQSELDPRNCSGKSAGFNGDGQKLAGGRYDSVHTRGNPSPLGGEQGGQGKIFGFDYPPNSVVDRVFETYAGPHDFLNSWGYDAFGNLKNQTAFESFLGKTLNPLNVVIATPIAVSSTIPRTAYSAPSIIYGETHRNDR
jgi:filamentous hemagglutinin